MLLKIGRPGFDSLAESDQKTLNVGIHNMGVGSGEQGGAARPCPPPLDFHRWYRTDKVEGGLMVLYIGLVFTVTPAPLA